MNFPKNGRKSLLAGLAVAACFALSAGVQAQICTVSNWDAGTLNLVDGADNASGDVGTQKNGYKRYGGPCGLKVPFGSPAAYVENSTQGGDGSTALDELYYIARFYVFPGELTASGGAAIFTAFDSGDAELFSVLYNSDTSELSFNLPGATNPAPVPVDAGKWHSVEPVYDATGDSFAFSIDRAIDEDEDGTIDAHATSVSGTFNNNVAAVQLGNIDGAGSGFAYFDDFDSRRTSFPGRLMVGDADGSGAITISDLFAVEEERGGGDHAAGQPDCDESGAITISDLFCVETLRTGG